MLSKSSATEKGAIAPGDKEITVHHSNAIRVEKAGLAKAFHDESFSTSLLHGSHSHV